MQAECTGPGTGSSPRV